MYYFVEVSCVIAEMWMIHLFLSSFLSEETGKSCSQFCFTYFPA